MAFDRTNIYCAYKQSCRTGQRQKTRSQGWSTSHEDTMSQELGLRTSFNTKPLTEFVLLAPYPNRAFSFHFLESLRACVLQGERPWALFIPLNSDLMDNLSQSSQQDYRVVEFLGRFASSPKRKLDSWRPAGTSLPIASTEMTAPSRVWGWKKHSQASLQQCQQHHMGEDCGELPLTCWQLLCNW